MNKIIAVLASFLIVAIAILGYVFYDSFKDIYGGWEGFISKQKGANANQNAVIPAGTEIPLDSVGQAQTSTKNPQGGEIPFNTDKPQTNKNNDNSSGQNISLDTSTWKTYTNKKYNYSFKYPTEYDYSSCDNTNPCRTGQVYEKDGGDAAWLNGAVNNRGWPYIIISHYDNDSYTLPEKTKFWDWLQKKAGWSKDNAPKDYNTSITTVKGDPKEAMRLSIPATPQAYARDEIYFEVKGKIFQIQLMNPSDSPAQEFYNTWLKTFVLN